MGYSVESKPNFEQADPRCVPFLMLSCRERETLQLAANGLTADEIGNRLGISGRTVDFYRKTIGKIGMEGYKGTINNDYNNQSYITVIAMIQDGVASGCLRHDLPEGYSPIPLTPRENEILEMSLQGKTIGKTSRELRIARGTVEVHRSHIHEKLKTENMYHLAARVTFLKREGIWPKPGKKINIVY